MINKNTDNRLVEYIRKETKSTAFLVEVDSS